MKKVSVKVGARRDDIRDQWGVVGHRISANTIVNIVGSYGLSSDGNMSHWERQVDVLVPEWVQPSQKWSWNMSRHGYKSNSGSDNLCFVTCKNPVQVDTIDAGHAKQDMPDVLIQKAIDGGFQFHFPIEDGSMGVMDVEIAK